MSLTKVSGFILLAALVLASCDNPASGTPTPAVTMSPEEAAKVVAAAGSAAQTSTARAVMPATETVVENPAGGSMKVVTTMENEKMKMESTYTDYVVKVDGETYTLNGGMVIQLVSSSSSYNPDTGIGSMNMDMTMTGTMSITKRSAVFTQTADLVYSFSTLYPKEGKPVSTVTIKGTMAGQTVNETQTM